MALDFPNTPTTGALYTGPDGTTWKWDGAKWVTGVATGLLSASQMDLGTRLAAAGTKLNALGPVLSINQQSTTPVPALDTAMNYNTIGTHEWQLPPATPGACLAVTMPGSLASCTIRPNGSDVIVAPRQHLYTNAAPMVITGLSNSSTALLWLSGRVGAWDILAASDEIEDALAWVQRPYFAGLYNGATVAITASTYTKCVIDTVQFDSHGWWDSTNTRYIPKRPGKYMAVYEANIGAAGAGSGPTVIQAAVYLSGAPASSRIISFNGTAFLPYQNFLGVTSIVACNGTTDYIEPWAYVGGGSAPAILGGATNQFFVTYLGP